LLYWGGKFLNREKLIILYNKWLKSNIRLVKKNVIFVST
jgi:hypothetical protein